MKPRALFARLSTREGRVLAALVLCAGAVLVFLHIVDEIIFEREHEIDRILLKALRGVEARPSGPAWLASAAQDITALGSTSVLTLVTLATVIFLLLARRYRSALYVAFATVGGTALVQLLKPFFGRSRPDVVPDVAALVSMSFPSGHATLAAATYLVLAALVARTLPSFVLKIYAIALALLVTLLVGLSRIYLGFHWPSDVVAGWTLGAAWALLCWAAAEALER